MNVCVYIYICMSVYVCLYVYIYLYIHNYSKLFGRSHKCLFLVIKVLFLMK